MPWFWGKSKRGDDHDEEEEYSSEGEEYSSDDDDVSYITSDDETGDIDDTSSAADGEEEEEQQHGAVDSSREEVTETVVEDGPSHGDENRQVDDDEEEKPNNPNSSDDEDIVAKLLNESHDGNEESEERPVEQAVQEEKHLHDDPKVEEVAGEGEEEVVDHTDDEDSVDSVETTDSANEQPHVEMPELDTDKKVEVTAADVDNRSENVEEDDNSSKGEDDEVAEEHTEEEEEDEEVTSIYEKQSLLILAAEHDRVDIIKAILDAENSENTSKEDAEEERLTLMNGGIPPLHIAIAYGSVNAATSLLRMGADPSVRPCVADVKQQQAQQPEGTKAEIPNMDRFDDLSAWELLFGFGDGESPPQSGSRWSLFGSSSSQLEDDVEEPSNPRRSPSKRRKGFKPVNLAPSKREGIRHAFTAEALRCIGSDEVDRLRQLVDSGMPPSIELGGKDLLGWTADMDAKQCQAMLREYLGLPDEELQLEDENGDAGIPSDAANNNVAGDGGSGTNRTSAVLDRGGSSLGDGSEPSLSQLKNRLDELDSLGQALSTCLDNLAEEVSVCHGLLLNNMGGSGASALASHVRSLKTLRQQREDQLYESQHEMEEAQYEMQQLVQRIGPQLVAEFSSRFEEKSASAEANAEPANGPTHSKETPKKEETEEQKRRELRTQIVASESRVRVSWGAAATHFITHILVVSDLVLISLLLSLLSTPQVRKLRASIADLSEAQTRDLAEVEKRGLSGGIKLVRNLREELRDIEFQLAESKRAVSTCRTQSRLLANAAKTHLNRQPPASQPPEKEHVNQGDEQLEMQQQQKSVMTEKPTETVPPISSENKSPIPDDKPAAAVENVEPPAEALQEPDSGNLEELSDNSIIAEEEEDEDDDYEEEESDDEVGTDDEDGDYDEEDDVVLVKPPVLESDSHTPEEDAPNQDVSTKELESEDDAACSAKVPKVENDMSAVADKGTGTIPAETKVLERAKPQAPPMEFNRASLDYEEGNMHTISVDKHGYFSLDIWVVLLRMMGFDGAATSRQYSKPQQLQPQGKTNLMIV